MDIKDPDIYFYVLIAVLLLLISSGCINGNGGNDLIILEDGDVIDQTLCSEKGLNSQITVFHSQNCPACLETVPVLEEIESESDIKFEFISTTEEKDRIYDLGLATNYIPGVIIDCKVYVGYKTKQEFEDIISG